MFRVVLQEEFHSTISEWKRVPPPNPPPCGNSTVSEWKSLPPPHHEETVQSVNERECLPPPHHEETVQSVNERECLPPPHREETVQSVNERGCLPPPHCVETITVFRQNKSCSNCTLLVAAKSTAKVVLKEAWLLVRGSLTWTYAGKTQKSGSFSWGVSPF